MSEKPNAVIYMLKRGLINGLTLGFAFAFLTTILFTLLVVIFIYPDITSFSLTSDDLLAMFTSNLTVFIVGIMISLFFSLLNGSLLWFLTRRTNSSHETVGEMKVYTLIVIVTFVVSVVLPVIIFENGIFTLLLSLPLAAFLIPVAVNDSVLYIKRLQELKIPKRKRKTKNDELVISRLSGSVQDIAVQSTTYSTQQQQESQM